MIEGKEFREGSYPSLRGITSITCQETGRKIAYSERKP
jgi:hypothetical protein